MTADSASPPVAGYTVVPYRAELGAGVLRALNAAFPGGWGSDARWRWKQPERPGFVPEDVWVAAAGDEVVGCYSTTVLMVSLGDGIAVPLSFDGDLAVPPEHRGRGIPAAIRDASERWAFAAGVPLRGGFTTKGLNARVYHPHYGLTFFPAVTTEFRKALGLGPLRRPVALLGERMLARPRVRAALARQPLVVNLRVEGLGEGHVALTAHAFQLEPGLHPTSDFTVLLPAATVASARDGNLATMVRTVARESARGRVRIRGLMRSGPKLARLTAALMRRKA